jgi:hypothetical protein
MSDNETPPYRQFKDYTITNLKDCAEFLGNSAWIGDRAKEELEFREREAK